MSTDQPQPVPPAHQPAGPAPAAPPAPAAFQPTPPPPAAPQAPGLAVAAAVGAALLAGLAYGLLAKAIDREIGWAVFGIAAAVGVCLAKLGGRNPVLPPLGAVLTALGLFVGQFFAMSLFGHEELGIPVLDLLVGQADLTFEVWKESRDFMDVVFYGIALFFGFNSTQRFAS
ncbi:hypothetical protein ACIRBX_30120 [Kitasatospora sp. NPDC096147]|uniref:hypothetical protein n=1 Tax=Kitasatospora sp. NPDC096147 TaxID=3364093 RepID=UPI00380BA6AE